MRVVGEMYSRNRCCLLIVSLLVISLFYPSGMFRTVSAANTQDIMTLDANAEVLASRVSLSMDNDTEQKNPSSTNQSDSDLNNSDPFSTKVSEKANENSQLVIDDESDEKDQRNKSSTKNILDNCERSDDEECKNLETILKNKENSDNQEKEVDVKDEDISDEEQGSDKDTGDEKKSSDKFELPIDIPFP
jgi:hypothetical protein